MFKKIQNKIIILFVLILFLVLSGVLFVITRNVESEIVQKLKRDFKNSQITFDRIQKLNYERLVESSILISEEPQFKANVIFEKSADLELVHNTVLESINSLANLVKADLFIVTDNKGMELANFSEPEKYGDSLTFRSSIARAVNGIDPESSPKFIDIWEYDNSLYQVVSVPTYLQNNVIATLTLGSRISSFEVDTMKKQTGFEVTFILRDKIVASTFSITNQLVLAQEIAVNDEIMKAVHDRMESSELFNLNISEEKYFSVMAPVGTGCRSLLHSFKP